MNPEELLQRVRESIGAQTVFGEPIERDGVTVVPAAAVRGGGGGGGDSEGNGGGGFGLNGRPVGAYVIKDGEVTWRPALDPVRTTRGWQIVAALAALVLWSVARRRR